MPAPTVAVAAPNVLAARAGGEVARAGGNAGDVAVAAMVVACTTEPGICSLGGGGFATLAQPGAAAVTIDGYVARPGVGRAGPFDPGFDLDTEYGGGITITIGHGSVATPGTPPMLVELHRRGGLLPDLHARPAGRAGRRGRRAPRWCPRPRGPARLRARGAPATERGAGAVAFQHQPGGWSEADRRRTVEVLRAVLAHRVDVLDLAEDREAAGFAAVQAVIDGGLAGLTAPSTCHVSVIDRDELAVAVTCSAGYGSGVMPPGTGVWMNNCLGEKELVRHGPEGYEPGQRLPSNMTPTVGRAADGRVLAAGSPGADRITPSMLHVLAGIAGGMGIQAAIDAPRIHLTRWPDGRERLDVEEDVGLPADVAASVPRRIFPPHSMYYGGVAVTLAHEDGRLEAAADPRRDGGTAIT